MATKTTKKKVIVNVTLEQAQQAGETFTANTTSLEKIKAKMNAEINNIKSKYLAEITELQEGLAEPSEVLEVFAYEQKEGWGKKKSLELLHCIIGFRTGTPKVEKTTKKFTWDGIVEVMKKNNMLKKFLRVTEEVNKEAILAEKNEVVLNQLLEDCYIDVVQDESFYITAKAEEVAA